MSVKFNNLQDYRIKQLNISRSNKFNLIRERNDNHKNKMNMGKINKLNLESLLNNLTSNESKKCYDGMKKMDFIVLAEIYLQLKEYIPNELSLFSDVNMFVDLLSSKIPNLTINPNAIKVNILNAIESIKYKINLKENILLESKILKKRINHDYNEYKNSVNTYYKDQIPCGCPKSCSKCKGYMDYKMKTINRCISCTPYLSLPTKGYSCKTMYAQKVYNSVKTNNSSNPRMGICTYCMCDTTFMKIDINNKLKIKDEKIANNAINLKLLFVRGWIPSNIHDLTEIDMSINQFWSGRRDRKNQCKILHGDESAIKDVK